LIQSHGRIEAARPTRGDFEALPYPSMPFSYSQPSRLEAIAALFGFHARDASEARVLELGCASGGNIIPLAMRFPKASFLGLDISQKHIDIGRRRLLKLGTGNVELRQADLTDFSPQEKFDYVICHGVFSWVPTPTQDAIFRICRDSLSANGIAAISYNVLPGWHLRRVVRELCLHYVDATAPSHERVVQARDALKLTAKLSSPNATYGRLLRKEAERLARMPAAYISGEFLAADNAPCYFHEFADRAAQYSLSYLCEGDLAASTYEVPSLNSESQLPAGTSQTRAAMEQYKDFVSGRSFRRSILVRTEQVATVDPDPSAERLLGLHVASHLGLSSRTQADLGSVYKDARGRAVKVEDPTIRRAFSRLAEAYPSTIPVKELALSNNAEPDGSAAQVRICEALLKLLSENVAIISALPVAVGRAMDEKPRAWSVARAEASQPQPWMTGLHHEAVPFHPVIRYLLPHLSGEHDRAALNSLLTSAMLTGAVNVPELKDDKNTNDHVAVAAIAARYVGQVLDYLATHAVLEPANR
jgi:trans-aconitate methyltransferase/methyltransferase-like protein